VLWKETVFASIEGSPLGKLRRSAAAPRRLIGAKVPGFSRISY